MGLKPGKNQVLKNEHLSLTYPPSLLLFLQVSNPDTTTAKETIDHDQVHRDRMPPQ
jgi:hypothetical protein